MGRPASTNRDVIDCVDSVSRLLFFDNKTDRDSYRVDPVHLKFVEECSALWTKVIVYDSIERIIGLIIKYFSAASIDTVCNSIDLF